AARRHHRRPKKGRTQHGFHTNPDKRSFFHMSNTLASSVMQISDDWTLRKSKAFDKAASHRLHHILIFPHTRQLLWSNRQGCEEPRTSLERQSSSLTALRPAALLGRIAFCSLLFMRCCAH
uniref:Uncharacterized protein n=1 Tax=Parascaris univalens TaxID=6257 RepID=A0A915CHN8_PARUN